MYKTVAYTSNSYQAKTTFGCFFFNRTHFRLCDEAGFLFLGLTFRAVCFCCIFLLNGILTRNMTLHTLWKCITIAKTAHTTS